MPGRALPADHGCSACNGRTFEAECPALGTPLMGAVRSLSTCSDAPRPPGNCGQSFCQRTGGRACTPVLNSARRACRQAET